LLAFELLLRSRAEGHSFNLYFPIFPPAALTEPVVGEFRALPGELVAEVQKRLTELQARIRDQLQEQDQQSQRKLDRGRMPFSPKGGKDPEIEGLERDASWFYWKHLCDKSIEDIAELANEDDPTVVRDGIGVIEALLDLSPDRYRIHRAKE
jgi:hypothetical protein